MLNLIRDTCHICLVEIQDSDCDLSALSRIGASILGRAVVFLSVMQQWCAFW